MTLKVKPVDPRYIQAVWPIVEDYLKSALDKGATEESREYNIHHIRAFAASGQWILLVAMQDDKDIQGAATVSFISYPQHRVAFVTAMGGKFVANPEVFEQLKDICKEQGATKIQAFCRDSVAKLLEPCGFNKHSNLVEVLI